MFSTLNIRIGFFLAKRQIKRTSPWTTILIIFVMVFTFINLVVISGILVGLIQGAVNAVREHYTSDVFVSKLNNKTYIENSPEVIRIIKSLPQVEVVSARYSEGGTLEANYKTRKSEKDKPNITQTTVIGVDPTAEDKITNLSKFVIEGEYLAPGDYDQILIGAFLDKKYLDVDYPSFSPLDNIKPGVKVRMSIGGIEREVTVKGIIKAKVDQLDMSAIMIDSQLRSMIGRNDYNVDEISVKLKKGADPIIVRDILKRNGVDKIAKVQTFYEAMPKMIQDMVDTFDLLGNILSSIGLVVASITIFIVIFINAITRRKFIGILKGIGISAQAIEISYIMQSFFYALCGSVIGVIFLYGFLEPFITAHPIDFTFADGILVAPVGGTIFRIVLLMVTTIIAGFVPARLVVRKNTLDSILGRN
ncbi:MAG: FtsX-like permease family protein [Candidatus Paceibacterota bacterium]|jgi:ABC-type lipoprotein release transport system permease subunit